MAIQQTLKKLGFNDKEVKVYLTLLKHGKTKPSILAKMTKLNRATLYNVANSLVSKGIIVEDRSGNTLCFTPLPPNNLVSLVEQSKREIKEKESLIKNAVDELSLITADKIYPVPKIRFVEENDLEKYLFDNLTKWQEAIIESDGIWWGFQDQSFPANYEKWLDHTWETPQSKFTNYRAQFFSDATEIEKKLKSKYPNSKREVKPLAETHFTANTWVCGDFLVMIVTNQRPFYLLEIHDKILAHNTREILKKLWSSRTI